MTAKVSTNSIDEETRGALATEMTPPRSREESIEPHCWCGLTLPARSGPGRPRRCCCLAHSRQRDHWLRQLTLRQDALRLWQSTQDYPRSRVRAEVKQLRSEIAALLVQLHGGGFAGET
jgi:hypothetical protein